MRLNLIGHHHGKRHGPLYTTPATLKLALGLAIICGTVLIPFEVRAWFISVTVALGILVLLSRIPLLFLLKRLLLLSPFIIGVAVLSQFQQRSGTAWIQIAGKSILCLITVILIAHTTPFASILKVLKTIRVPGLLITTIALMHRYLFVLAEEAERMRRARASRSFTSRRRFRWHALATVIGQLFIRASERAERIYAAMCARGWS